MATCISHSPAETAALGEQWGRAAESGLVIGLSGDLGAGKTQLVKGLAHGLGITTRVHSPTFALVNIYSGGRLTLFHLDLYRLDTREQIAAAGLEEYLKPAGVTVIEWAERWFGQVQSPKSKVQSPQRKVRGPQSALTDHQSPITNHQSPITRLAHPYRRVQIEVLSETERRISYEDSGA
ncbi:MAG: tRNA (adenosine(37)-N6)-threonylcarbamoyltransferase complex ATPase subunit type 1 TsaE [Verrucomicrobiota bacterium]|jgi:tRNA threonylcarbamoyladenosine biosynthesis protein TsaE